MESPFNLTDLYAAVTATQDRPKSEISTVITMNTDFLNHIPAYDLVFITASGTISFDYDLTNTQNGESITAAISITSQFNIGSSIAYCSASCSTSDRHKVGTANTDISYVWVFENQRPLNYTNLSFTSRSNNSMYLSNDAAKISHLVSVAVSRTAVINTMYGKIRNGIVNGKFTVKAINHY